MCKKIQNTELCLERGRYYALTTSRSVGAWASNRQAVWTDADRLERPTFVHQVARVLRRYQCLKVDQDPFRAARAPWSSIANSNPTLLLLIPIFPMTESCLTPSLGVEDVRQPTQSHSISHIPLSRLAEEEERDG